MFSCVFVDQGDSPLLRATVGKGRINTQRFPSGYGKSQVAIVECKILNESCTWVELMLHFSKKLKISPVKCRDDLEHEIFSQHQIFADSIRLNCKEVAMVIYGQVEALQRLVKRAKNREEIAWLLLWAVKLESAVEVQKKS